MGQYLPCVINLDRFDFRYIVDAFFFQQFGHIGDDVFAFVFAQVPCRMNFCAFIVRCVDVIRDAYGEVTELRCEFDPDTRSGFPGASRKVKGTIHWVSAVHGVRAEVRLCDRLFNVPNPLADKSRDFLEFLNPHSLDVLPGAVVEPSVAEGKPGDCYQFERSGYFVHDIVDSRPGKPVLNRAVSLRDSWAKASQP